MRAYDAAYAYELGHIVKDGLARMYGPEPENIYYYLTVYNEPINQPAEPEGVDVDGILRGMHRISPLPDARAQLLASGISVTWALRAQQILAEEWGIPTDVWSVTSWNELRRDGLDVDRDNFLNPDRPANTPFITQQLAGREGPVIAVSDYMRAVQDQVAQWVPTDFHSLGTDGWGQSDTRGALRRHFLVDAESIVVRTLTALVDRGEVTREQVAAAIRNYQLTDPAAADAGNSEGSG